MYSYFDNRESLKEFTNAQNYFFYFVVLQNGMGKLHITSNGIRMEGVAEFVAALRAKQIVSKQVVKSSHVLLIVPIFYILFLLQFRYH